MWKRSFRARLPPKCESWRCENEAFVRDLPQKVKVKDVKTKLSCETSLKSESSSGENEAFVRDFFQNLKVDGICENETFVRDLPQNVKVEDAKTKLSCETSRKKWKWKMWKRRFRARLPSDFESSSGESEAWTVSSTAGLIWEWSRFKRTCSETVRGTRFPINLLKHVLSCKTQHFVHPPTLKNRFRARLPSTGESWRCESEAFVRDSFKIWKWKMRKRSFRARRPSQSESWRCENEAFVQDFPQKVKVEDVKTTLSCKTSFRYWKFKWWSEAWTVSSTAGLIWEWSRSKQTCSETVRGTRFPINLLKHVLSCKTQHFVHPPTLKNRFRARLPSTSESWRCESEAFVRDSFKIWKWKMRKRSFRARRPSQSESWRCENEAFVQDFLQNLQVEYVRTKLSCETSLKTWKLKMWERSFRARLPSKSESWRCGSEAFVQTSFQNWFIQFNSFQFNSIQLKSIQFNSIQLNSIQLNSSQFNSNSTQSKSIEVNSSQFN